jgi:hypothetical protein
LAAACGFVLPLDELPPEELPPEELLPVVLRLVEAARFSAAGFSTRTPEPLPQRSFRRRKNDPLLTIVRLNAA